MERWCSPPPQLLISMYFTIRLPILVLRGTFLCGGCPNFCRLVRVHRLRQHMGSVPLGWVTFTGIRFLVHPTSLVQATIVEVFSTNHVGTMGFNLGETDVDHLVHALNVFPPLRGGHVIWAIRWPTQMNCIFAHVNYLWSKSNHNNI